MPKKKKTIDYVRLRIRLWRAAAIQRHLQDSGFTLFPPRFYRRHSPEEIKRRTELELAELRRLLAEYQRQNRIHEK
ncbi:MAG: hypothetical protein IJ747_04440 [Lachnospiraceae bacterium]|nr:hypothetical protein [Lachnospiraceae bacterium]